MLNIFRFFYIPLICLSIISFSCNNDDDDDDGNEIEEGGILWINCGGSNVDTTTFFVSVNGNDQNNGLSNTSAFRTIAKALSSVRPGGKVKITEGTYSECIGIELCGSANSSITIEGDSGLTILDGYNQKTMAFFCTACNNLIFSNLKIQNYTDIGLGVELSSNIEIENLEIYHNGTAVQLKEWELEGYGIHVETSQNVEIMNNIVYENGPDPQIIPAYMMGTGINTYGNTNVVIRNNKSYRNTGGGILVEDSFDVVVEDNDVYENDLDASIDGWWDGGLWLDGGGNVIVRNNNFHDNLGPGIEVSDEDKQSPKGYILENNLSNNNYYGIFIWNFGTNDWPDSTIIKNINNDFSGNSVKDVWIVDWFK